MIKEAYKKVDQVTKDFKQWVNEEYDPVMSMIMAKSVF